MIGKILQDSNKSKIFFPILIFFIWLAIYLICFFSWNHQIWWDETSYLTTARGIAENFDFGSRSTTVQGTIKYPYPQSTHHFPLYSTYVAIFFKLFGVSINAAYFSTWLAGLVCTLFIYFTMLILSKDNYTMSFISSLCFLFSPRITHFCDSGMMEVPGAALLSVLVYFVFKGISKNKMNPIFLGFAALALYLFKSLFIGVIVGAIFLISLSYKYKFSNLQQKSELLKFLCIYFSTLFIGYFALVKLLFLPLAPMLNFLPRVEGAEGSYADFAAGFFNNPIQNLTMNLQLFYQSFILRYLNYSIITMKNIDPFYISMPEANELAIYSLSIFFIIVFTIAFFDKFENIEKLFISFTLTAVFSMNLLYFSLFGGGLGLTCRYNLIYIPLVIISFFLVTDKFKYYLNDFLEQKKSFIAFFLLGLILTVYIPFYNAGNTITILYKQMYHDIASKNTDVIKKAIGNHHPQFIYFTSGNYSTWDLFPLRVIFMEATNEQIKNINLKLPMPIEFLFLSANNSLFHENQELILNAKPIIDNWYTFYGFDRDSQMVVYKFNPLRN